jgi:ATP-dependent helicase/nuclease subunit B
VRALYLPLDDNGEEIKGVDHPDLEEGARRLVEGIGMDLERLRQGAGLLPLGRGSACEHCDARGLCRRDHWAEPLNLDEAAS